jgi:hypothetical protein
MRAALFVLAAAGASLVASSCGSARAACTPGTHTTYRTFCGPAHATLKVGGKTLSFTGGSCQVSGSTFSINIGTVMFPPGKPKYDYFEISVRAEKGGTYTNQTVDWQLPRVDDRVLANATIKLAADRKSGSFSGLMIQSPRAPAGSGTFSCS